MLYAEDAIIARAATSRRAAVIGGGLLGLEAAKVPEQRRSSGKKSGGLAYLYKYIYIYSILYI